MFRQMGPMWTLDQGQLDVLLEGIRQDQVALGFRPEEYWEKVA